MTRRERIRHKRGTNQYQVKHKPFQSTYWNFLILPVVLTIGLWAQYFAPYVEQAFTVRSAYSSTISPLPEPSPTLPTGEVTPLPEPTPVSLPAVSGGGASAFVRRVHMLESTAGANDNPFALHNICRAQGGSNEFGYGGMALMICFDSFEEARARIVRWYHEHREQMSEPMVYCYYNLGLKTEDCPYWHNAKKL